MRNLLRRDADVVTAAEARPATNARDLSYDVDDVITDVLWSPGDQVREANDQGRGYLLVGFDPYDILSYTNACLDPLRPSPESFATLDDLGCTVTHHVLADTHRKESVHCGSAVGIFAPRICCLPHCAPCTAS